MYMKNHQIHLENCQLLIFLILDLLFNHVLTDITYSNEALCNEAAVYVLIEPLKL